MNESFDGMKPDLKTPSATTLSERSVLRLAALAITLVILTLGIGSAQDENSKELMLDLGGGVKLELVLIPAGKFIMGSPKTERGHPSIGVAGTPSFVDDYEIQHEVTISEPFYMGKYPVTQEQYEAVMGVNPSYFKGAKRPVERVFWPDTQAFCKKLSAQAGKQIRLPTEAEWEYGCRAGTTTPFYFGKSMTTKQANYDNFTPNYSGGIYDGKAQSLQGRSWDRTTDVGTFPPNKFGLYDMHGNVQQWCLDWFVQEYPKNAVIDPKGPEADRNIEERVMRGGSWTNTLAWCRSAARLAVISDPELLKWVNPNDGPLPNRAIWANLGFRVVVPSSRTP